MAEAQKWEDFTLNETLVKFARDLPEILSSAGHDEMYGITLQATGEG